MSAPIDPVRNPPPPAPAIDDRGLPVGSQLRPGWEVSPRAVRDGAAAPDAPLLLDCRRPEEWAFNRIAGATHVPMGEIESRLDDVEEAAGGRDRPIVVYCHHGVRSMRVAAALRAHGFSGAVSMAGGIDLWSIAVDPAVPRY